MLFIFFGNFAIFELGWKSSDCNIENPFCSNSLPCENGGKCTRVQNNTYCFCPKDFDGTHCQYPLLTDDGKNVGSGLDEDNPTKGVRINLKDSISVFFFCNFFTLFFNLFLFNKTDERTKRTIITHRFKSCFLINILKLSFNLRIYF